MVNGLPEVVTGGYFSIFRGASLLASHASYREQAVEIAEYFERIARTTEPVIAVCLNLAGELYAKLGRTEDAQRLEAELRDMGDITSVEYAERIRRGINF